MGARAFVFLLHVAEKVNLAVQQFVMDFFQTRFHFSDKSFFANFDVVNVVDAFGLPFQVEHPLIQAVGRSEMGGVKQFLSFSQLLDFSENVGTLFPQ